MVTGENHSFLSFWCRSRLAQIAHRGGRATKPLDDDRGEFIFCDGYVKFGFLGGVVCPGPPGVFSGQRRGKQGLFSCFGETNRLEVPTGNPVLIPHSSSWGSTEKLLTFPSGSIENPNEGHPPCTTPRCMLSFSRWGRGRGFAGLDGGISGGSDELVQTAARPVR